MSNLPALKSDRRRISGELGRVMEAQSLLEAATRAEDTTVAAIGALGAREIEAVHAWAEAGGDGPMPTPDVDERKRLHEQLVATQATASAARGALGSFDATQRDLGEELRSINGRIDVAAYDALAVCHANEVESIGRLVRDHVIPKIARTSALHALLLEIGRSHQASGRTDQARDLFQRASAIAAATPSIELEPLTKDVLGQMGAWSKRLAALTGDGAAEPDDEAASIVVLDPDHRRRQALQQEGTAA